MALTANREVAHYIDQELRSFQVAAGKHVYKGALVALSTTGYAQPLTAGDRFVGVAYEEIDNTAGVNGALSVRVYTLGDFGMTLSGAAIADVGRPVFGSADGTLILMGTGNSYVGVMQDLVSAGEIIARIDPNRGLVKTITHAVEDLAAGADASARAIHAFAGDAWILSSRIVNQATAAAGIDDMDTCVVTVGIDAGTVVSKTYNASVAFPAANTRNDLGSVANAHAGTGDVLTLSVINGATANPGPFLVEVDYV